MIVNVFDNGFLFAPTRTSEETPKPIPDDGAIATVKTFYSLEEAQAALDRELLWLDDDNFTLESLELHETNYTGTLLSASYKTQEGGNVHLLQEWDETSSSWAEINPDEKVWEETIFDGTVIYCFISTSDGVFSATTGWQDSIVTIYADADILYENILKAISHYSH